MSLLRMKITTALIVCLAMLWSTAYAATALQSNEKPDITIVGFLLNGDYVPGGPVKEVDASKATSFKNGKCLFKVEYDLKNTGEVTTSPSFNTVLKRGNTVVGTHSNQSLNAHSHNVLAFQNIELTPGMNDLGIYADDGDKVSESNESNNYRKALIKIRGNCGDGGQPIKAGTSTQHSLPGGPKPKCKMGEIPVMEDGMWQCKQPGLKAPSTSQRSLPGGPKPKCKMGEIAVMEDGMWKCKPPGLKAPSTSQRSLPGGPKPSCKLGEIAVMEDGMWKCKPPGLKAPSTSQRSLPGGPKPSCKLGEIAVMEDGMWKCKPPALKAQ